MKQYKCPECHLPRVENAGDRYTTKCLHASFTRQPGQRSDAHVRRKPLVELIADPVVYSDSYRQMVADTLRAKRKREVIEAHRLTSGEKLK